MLLAWFLRIGFVLMPFVTVSLLFAGEPTKKSTRLESLLEQISLTSSGQNLLERAKERWKFKSISELSKIMKLSDVSRTDAVLTRHYDVTKQREERERTVSISLNSRAKDADLMLDIVHEFVHAIANPEWDPYDEALTSAKYMKVAIDGIGGEVEAMTIECKVDLERSINTSQAPTRCLKYRVMFGSPSVNQELIRKDFYRVGKWYADLKKSLGSDFANFPHMSAESPILYSSTDRLPYPVALVNDFQRLNQVACENSIRRYTIKRGGRFPASLFEQLDTPSGNVSTEDLDRFLFARCKREIRAAMPSEVRNHREH